MTTQPMNITLSSQPADARWGEKAILSSNDSGIENWRPIFAAVDLYDKAIKRYGLTASGGVKDTVRDLAKKHNVKFTTARYTMMIDEPRTAVKTFKSSPMDDRQCFGRTLDTVERDMGRITERANAWATGARRRGVGGVYPDRLHDRAGNGSRHAGGVGQRP